MSCASGYYVLEYDFGVLQCIFQYQVVWSYFLIAEIHVLEIVLKISRKTTTRSCSLPLAVHFLFAGHFLLVTSDQSLLHAGRQLHDLDLSEGNGVLVARCGNSGFIFFISRPCTFVLSKISPVVTAGRFIISISSEIP